jgi:LmbE family N-acetylglucosaminyl deacetylase
MMRTGLLLLAVIARAAEFDPDRGAAGTLQALKRLNTTVSVLHITAHPDDEDASLLTYLSRGRGFRTGLLSLTRGEGGANLAGPEMYDALGLLRTEETLAAARHYGVELFFTRAIDFGFSKRLDETLEHWDKQEVLRDVVRVIRTYRPDIVIGRFHGKARDGHGNHQTAGLMAVEGFKAAADPKLFPELDLPAWKATKLYLSTRSNEPHTLKIDVGEFDPLLGKSYRDLGVEGYREHRSQGMAAASAQRWTETSYLQLVEGTPDKEIGAGAVLNAPDAVKHAAAALAEFDARRPWASLPHITEGLKALRAAMGKSSGHERWLLTNKEQQFVEAANRALGLTLDAVAADANGGGVARGQTFAVDVSISIPSAAQSIEAGSLELRAGQGWSIRKTKADGRSAQFEVRARPEARLSRPAWARTNNSYLYSIVEKQWQHAPNPPAPLVTEFKYRVAGVDLAIRQPVESRTIDRLWGEQRHELALLPPVGIAISPDVLVTPVGTIRRTSVTAEVRSTSRLSATVRLKLPAGWSSQPEQAAVAFEKGGEVRRLPFELSHPALKAGESFPIFASVESAGITYEEGFQPVGYRGLSTRYHFRPAKAQVRAVDVKIAPSLEVGYIEGAGDETKESLEQLGVKLHFLEPAELATADLSRFTAIIAGLRASAVRTDWKEHRERLLDYVQRGGHLIVQYQTQEFDEAPYGPFPYRLTARAEEVSEENAPVIILNPQHPFFLSPNRITQEDFRGWSEERGSKFMTEWDSRYVPLLESHDRDQAPQRGGLLTAEYGKGRFTYAAYAFYRQLPAGVPGAYRLFANILSSTKEK